MSNGAGTNNRHAEVEEEEEDYVVASYDVYLSTTLSGNVHLFQFPLRPFPRPYEATSLKLHCTKGEGIGTASNGGHNNANKTTASSNNNSMQKQHQLRESYENGRFTMEVDLDAYDSPCFRVAAPAPGKEAGTFSYYLSSEPFIPRSNYAVGVLKENGLHLCPISTIQQFTPVVRAETRMIAPSGSGGVDDFSGSNIQYQNGAGQRIGAGGSSSSPSTAGGPLVAVESKFCSLVGSAPEGPGALLTREQESLRLLRSTLLNVDAATSQPMAFYHLATPESQTKTRMLTSTVLSNSTSVIPQPDDEGIRPRKNVTSTTETFFSAEKLLDTGAETSKRIVLKRGGRFGIREQVQDLIVSAQVLTTGDVLSMVEDSQAGGQATSQGAAASSPSGTALTATYSKVVRALLEFAYYMHGVWVSRTPPLKSGFPQIRDLVLLKFAQSENGILYRADVSKELTRNHPAVRKAVLKALDSVAELIDPTRRHMHNSDLSDVWGTHERSFGLSCGVESRANASDEATADIGRAWRLRRSVWKNAAATATSEPVSALHQRVLDLTSTPQDFAVFNSKFEKEFKTDISAQNNLWVDGGRNQRIVAESIKAINEGRDVGVTQSGIIGGGGLGGGGGAGGASLRPQQQQQPMSSMMPSSTSSANQSITAAAGAISTPAMVNNVKQYINLLFKEHGVINKSQAKQKIQQQTRDQQSVMYGASTDALAKACRELLVGFTQSTFVLTDTPSADVAPYRRFILAATCERSQFTSSDVIERVVSLVEKDQASSNPASAATEVNRVAVKGAVNAMLPEVAEFKNGEKLWHVKSGTIDM